MVEVRDFPVDGDDVLGCAARAFGPDGGRVVAWTWGSGRTVMVFLHALLPASSGRSIAETAIALTSSLPVRVVGVDAPGFGLSDPGPATDYELERLATRLGEVADAAAGSPYLLAGHSWGAALAVRIAAQRPERITGVALLDGGHFDHADLPDADPNQDIAQTIDEMDTMGWRHDADSLDKILAQYRPSDGDQRPLLPHVVKAGLIEKRAGGWQSRVSPPVAGAAMHALMGSRTSRYYPVLAAHQTPMLLVIATEPTQRRHDNQRRARLLRTALPQVVVVEIPGCRHDVFLDAPSRVAEIIESWWPSLDPASDRASR